jgi:hypothetical protein
MRASRNSSAARWAGNPSSAASRKPVLGVFHLASVRTANLLHVADVQCNGNRPTNRGWSIAVALHGRLDIHTAGGVWADAVRALDDWTGANW